MKIVVDLNNEAVSYLQEGNYYAAVWDLEMAMDRLRHHRIWGCPPQTRNSYEDGTLRVDSVPIAPVARENEAFSNVNVFEFYRRAFRIVSCPTQQHRIHALTNMIVVKFNMAVAYHDDGIRRNRTTHFERALELYEEILHSMQHYRTQGHILLVMAIGNNMGHIHSHLLNYDQTREALYWIRQLAITSREHSSTVPLGDYAFFYKTVAIFNGNDLNIAPAA